MDGRISLPEAVGLVFVLGRRAGVCSCYVIVYPEAVVAVRVREVVSE